MAVYNTNDDDSTHTHAHDPTGKYKEFTKKNHQDQTTNHEEEETDDAFSVVKKKDNNNKYYDKKPGERIASRPGKKSLHHGFMDDTYANRPKTGIIDPSDAVVQSGVRNKNNKQQQKEEEEGAAAEQFIQSHLVHEEHQQAVQQQQPLAAAVPPPEQQPQAPPPDSSALQQQTTQQVGNVDTVSHQQALVTPDPSTLQQQQQQPKGQLDYQQIDGQALASSSSAPLASSFAGADSKGESGESRYGTSLATQSLGPETTGSNSLISTPQLQQPQESSSLQQQQQQQNENAAMQQTVSSPDGSSAQMANESSNTPLQEDDSVVREGTMTTTMEIPENLQQEQPQQPQDGRASLDYPADYDDGILVDQEEFGPGDPFNSSLEGGGNIGSVETSSAAEDQGHQVLPTPANNVDVVDIDQAMQEASEAVDTILQEHLQNAPISQNESDGTTDSGSDLSEPPDDDEKKEPIIKSNEPILIEQPKSLSEVKEMYESNYNRWNHPYDSSKDIPVFWRIPRSASSTIESSLSFCYRQTLANSMGLNNGHAQDTSLDIVTLGTGAQYMNVDMASPAGIHRANEMNLADSNYVNAISTPFILETASVFKGSEKGGKCFTLLRHPVDRAISFYHHYQTDAGKDNPSTALYHGMSIDEFADKVAENNWMVRFLSDKRGGALTWKDLEVAKDSEFSLTCSLLCTHC